MRRGNRWRRCPGASLSAVTYVTGWESVDTTPLPRGPRHAVPLGMRISVCRIMAQIRDDQPFALGGLDDPPCSDCLALDRAAASA